jgi:predicted nucleic acid-binding protein
MAFPLDTNVAIHLRDGDPKVMQKVAALEDAVLISVVTRVELEGGVYREPAQGTYSQGAARRHAERHSSVGVR